MTWTTFSQLRLLPSAVIAIATLGLLASHGLAPLQRDAADLMVRAATSRPPAAAPAPDVVIIAIDAQSLRGLPGWPWPRGIYGQLVERLDAVGVRAVGFDVDFSTPRDPAEDERFAAAVARSGRVAFAAFRQVQRLPGGVEVELASLPLPALAKNAAALGSVVVPLDPDSVVRRFPRATPIAGRPTPSLAAATLAIALREDPETFGTGSDGTGAGTGTRTREAYARVDYRRFSPPVPVLSLVDVLEGRFDPGTLAGRIVLVGPTALELQDLWPTPVGPSQPGVLVQALALRTLAAEHTGQPVLRKPSRRLEAGLALAVVLLAGALGTLRHGRRVLALGGLALAIPATQLGLLVTRGWLLDPVVPVGVLGAHYVLGLESVRRRFGRRLEERDLSLATLFQVGKATASAASASAAGGLDLALALLGDVVGASGVAFLRAAPDGVLDGRRLEWSRQAGDGVGDEDTAREVLDSRELRVFEKRIPGVGARPGLAVYLPLLAGDDAVGVLVVEREHSAPLEETEIRTIATAGAQLALSAQNLRLIDDLRTSFDTSVAAIASAIEARDGYTESHCRRLAAFSVAMGTRLGLPEQELEAIRLGALLHDVGKIGIRDEVLLKPGRFTPEERAIMESHAALGHGIVGQIHGISETSLQCIRHHHERWDGSGYPDQLSGEAIPLGARVVSVVDVWDALSTKRPYKEAMPQEKVREILEKGRGDQFDPDLLDLFFQVLEEEGEEMLDLIDRTVVVTA